MALPEFDVDALIHGGSGEAGSNLRGSGIFPSVDNRTAWEVIIPAAKLRADVVGLGVLPNGAFGAPDNPDVIGWWQDGPMPGEPGNVLLDGHRDYTDVDGNVGLGVAWALPEVALGDQILVVDREAGVTHVYLVTQTLSVPHDDPDGGRFLQSTTTSMLTLVTCEGSFDRAERLYSERRIVTAVLLGMALDVPV